MGLRLLAWWSLEDAGGSEGPAHSNALNDLLCPVARVVALREGKSGTEAPRSPIPSVAFTRPLWDGPLEGRPRVSVSPQEAGSPEWRVVWLAEGWAKVRALVSASVGPRVWAWGTFKCRPGPGGLCPFSRPE